MGFSKYVNYWLALTLVLVVEYFAIKFVPSYSLIGFCATKLGAKDLELVTASGRPIGHALGWIGFSIIFLTNFYILRKRFVFLQKWGTSAGWLDFHMFCGLIGPTFIVFHSDFKVRGLVAISFWSMVIIAVSGIMGRYFYLQISSQKSELEGVADRLLNKFNAATSSSPIDESKRERIVSSALAYVGVPERHQRSGEMPLFSAFFFSLIGDFRLSWYSLPTIAGQSEQASYTILNYALQRRRILFLTPFQNLFGYWHAFHLPFSFFMYIAAVIHIFSSSIFKVS